MTSYRSDQAGLVDSAWWRERQDDYLAAATSVFVPSSPTNVIDHLEWSSRNKKYRVDWAAVDEHALTGWFHRIDSWSDCADFDVLRLLTIWFGYRDHIPSPVADAIRDRCLTFTYWYTDPKPADVVDQRWYWSENHRLMFHSIEYLAGQAFMQERFAATNMSGAEHRERARKALTAWFDEKARYGFSEWHSDSYYEKDLAPLVTLAEFADDVEMAERASAFADLVLFDLALHSHRGNVGSTHGRSYMRFKADATHQTAFAAVKMCFATTDEPWPLDNGDAQELLPQTEIGMVLARCSNYRPPEILRRVASHTGVVIDREGMGVAIDPAEALIDLPKREDELSYTDPAMVPFWWDRGALTPWQLIPLTVDTLDRYGLWDAGLFAQFKLVRDGLGGGADVMREISHDLNQLVNAGLLSRVDTYTWRNGHGMLSTAQSYRPGCVGYQHHISQATLDERAIVFTNHPGNEASLATGDYRDDDRYWTGSATLPRAVQHGRVAIQIYAPAFRTPDLEILSGFAYCDYTHAYFPTERFDEVICLDHWRIGRRGGGYAALWSWRLPEWRSHDPEEVFTNGLAHEFDLVALGGAENVWILELGDVDQWGSFERFCDSVTTAPVDVVDKGWGEGSHLGFDVTYRSPAEGRIELGWDGPLVVDGREVKVGGHPRFDNPFTHVAEGETLIEIRDEVGSFTLDLTRGTRGSQTPLR